LNNPDFVGTGWQGTFVVWAVLLSCVIINVFISGALPIIEVLVLVVHVLGFFGILIPLVYLAPSHNSAKTVFATFNNQYGWSSQVLSFLIGLQGNALAFVGTDSAVHVSLRFGHAAVVLTPLDVGRS
jgi:choline transport protein